MRVILTAAALAFASPASAALTAGDRAAIAAPQRPHLDTRAAQLPPSVRSAFAAGALADAGEPFQITDVVVGKPLPGARMIWGARIGRLYVLHLERGGIAHYFLAEVYDLTGGAGGPARRIWRGLTPGRLASYADFQAAWRAHKLTEMN